MSKLSKEDLIKKVSEKIEDSDLQLELMEDITDSFEVNSDKINREDFDKLTKDYDDLKEKYRSRFLEVDDKKDDKKDEEKKDDELETVSVIDVKDI